MLTASVTWRFAARLLRWPRPGRWTMRIITVAAFAGVLLQFRTINGLTPGTGLLVVMVALKFLEARSQRDHMILIVIAYFLVFASLLAGGGLVLGLYLLAFVWLTTLGLLQVGRVGPLLPSGPTAKQAGKLLLQSLPLMVVLFILFPRLSGPLWSMPGDTSSGASGLTDSMSPGDITELGLSDEIAFRVEFTGQEPAASELYWRGPVLTRFDGRTWSRPEGTRGDTRETIDYLGAVSRYRVTLDSEARGWAFALEMPEQWDTGERRRQIRMSSDYQLLVWPPGGSNQRLTYDVTSYSEYRALEPLRDSHRAAFTRLPEGFNPRTRALVDQITADAPDAATIIERALEVFRGEDFFYTLTPPPLGEHTADDFIFETREGFCEHYASAFAIMMRMAGLPARVVMGYQGGELNAMGDYYIIRQSNAHAWTEVWTEDGGWQRVDPISAVAPERIAIGSTRTSFAGETTMVQRISRMTVLRQLALTWDAVNTAWGNWIIDYGPSLQRDLLEWFGFERPRWRELLILSIAAAAGVMAALTLWFTLRTRRREHRDAAAQDFRRFVRKLRSQAIEPMRTGETATQFARRARASLPAQADAIERITAAYLAARYEPDSKGLALAELRRLVANFRPGYVPASR